MSKSKPIPKKRPRGTGTIRLRGGLFEARWRGDDGKEIAQRWPTEAAAVKQLDEELVKKRRARERGERYANPNAAGPTFAVIAEEWFVDRALRLTPKTIVSYRSVLDVHLLPTFGRMHVRKITLESIEKFNSSLIEKGLRIGTRRNIMRVLGPIMRRARRHGHTDSNVMADIEQDKATDLLTPQPTTISGAQVELLASLIEPHYAPLVIFAAYTGMRAGEIAGLQWGDLDLVGGWVNVQRSLAEVSLSEARRTRIKTIKPGFLEGPPKNKRSRNTILLPSVAKSLGPPGEEGQRVFLMRSGTVMRWDNWRKRVWAPAVRAAVKATAESMKREAERGAAGRRVESFPASLRFHDLRHAFVSLAYNEVGLNPKQIAEMSGHRDLALMLNVYTHVFGGWDEKLAERFEAVRNKARLTLIEGDNAEPRQRGAA